MSRPRRYTTLEGMRGIGAIYVVLLHGELLFGAAAPQSAYLGVDFFFVLSGFIVAHVYAQPLDDGLPITAFLRSRLLRLYPVYLLGMLTGVALAVESMVVGHSDLLWNYTQPLISLPFAMALLPSPVSDAMFPLDIPAWSLLLEFVINIVFAVRCLRSTRSLLAIMAVAGVVLVNALVTMDTLNFGWNKPTGILGLARIAFSFPLGVFVYRLHRRLPSLELPGWFFLVPTLTLTLLMYATPSGGDPHRVRRGVHRDHLACFGAKRCCQQPGSAMGGTGVHTIGGVVLSVVYPALSHPDGRHGHDPTPHTGRPGGTRRRSRLAARHGGHRALRGRGRWPATRPHKPPWPQRSGSRC